MFCSSWTSGSWLGCCGHRQITAIALVLCIPRQCLSPRAPCIRTACANICVFQPPLAPSTLATLSSPHLYDAQRQRRHGSQRHERQNPTRPQLGLFIQTQRRRQSHHLLSRREQSIRRPPTRSRGAFSSLLLLPNPLEITQTHSLVPRSQQST